MPSGRNFVFIASVEVETWYQGLTSELKKNNDRPIFDEIRFLSSGGLDLAFSIYFRVISIFSVTRRAGWAHPNSKSNTVFGKSSF